MGHCCTGLHRGLVAVHMTDDNGMNMDMNLFCIRYYQLAAMSVLRVCVGALFRRVMPHDSGMHEGELHAMTFMT